MRDLGVMEKNKIGRAEIILNKILQSPTISIEDSGGIIHIDNQPLGLKASTFLYNTQQSTKKIDIQKYSRALLALDLPPHLVSNTYANQILEPSESEEEIFARPRGQSGSGYQVTNQRKTGTRKKTAEGETKQQKWSYFFREKNVGPTVFEGTCIVWKPKAIKNPKQIIIW